MSRQAALSNRVAPPRIGRNCRISMATKLVLADPMNPYLQHETSSICVCLICRVASSCSARFFPNGCNPSLPREKDIPTKGYSPPPPWGSAIRITSPFIRWIIRCRAKLFADITVTFLPGNSLTPLRSMARRRLRLHGFIRARSIFCADASLFCSGKIENPVCQSFRHSSFGFRHYLATLANDHYKKIMKLARWSVGIFLAAPTLLFAADELAERLQPALEAITPDGLLAHIKVLASDELEGRAPGTKGEELSVQYISDQFKQMGLKPGNPDGTYTQEVPLAGIKSEPRMSFTVGDKTLNLKFPDDFVASSARLQPEIKIDKSDVVFVGYGVVAPEYGWNDYKEVDVRGKTILMLIGDPPLPDPKDPSKLDDKMFKGKAMTYYGRWTYKYEIAAQKGAAAAIIIHETEPAAYPWQVVKSSWAKENFELDNPNKNMDAVPARSWITLDVAKRLLADCGQDFDALKKSAITKEFKPVALNAKAKIDIKQALRSFKSHNVIGKFEGADPNLKDEYIIYSAHWDHLGRHPELQGDQIFNGAVDNASGDAAVIALASAFPKADPAPKRSILFMCTTAEEAGLLGAKWYAEHPLYPLGKTLADINIDSMNVWGKARDIEDVSYGVSTMDDALAAAAKRQSRTAIPNSRPEKGHIYRADNFEFAKVGLPSLYIGKGEHLFSRPENGPLRSDEYDLKDYHQPSDDVKPDWDLSGAVQDVDLLFEVGYQVANADKFPEWKPGNEFKPKRDAMMKK